MIPIAGRKGKFDDWLTEDGLTRIEGWARDGLSEEQIAHNMGICYDTLNEWKKRFSDISDAIKKGKAPADQKVENALYKTATGYKVTLKKPIKIKTTKKINGKGEVTEEHVEYHDEEIYIKPDTTAQIFWLKNRRPDRWRDKRDEAPAQGNELLHDLGVIMGDGESNV